MILLYIWKELTSVFYAALMEDVRYHAKGLYEIPKHLNETKSSENASVLKPDLFKSVKLKGWSLLQIFCIKWFHQTFGVNLKKYELII